MKIGAALIVSAITLVLAVSTSVGGAAYLVGGKNKEVEYLKAEQIEMRAAIKPIPVMKRDIEWIRDQLKEITKHLGAPESKK
jgi:5-bromo-4-chloroindolyl phosphate hydrolysis protein